MILLYIVDYMPKTFFIEISAHVHFVFGDHRLTARCKVFSFTDSRSYSKLINNYQKLQSIGYNHTVCGCKYPFLFLCFIYNFNSIRIEAGLGVLTNKKQMKGG